MAAKRMMGFAAGLAVAGFALPLMAQQAPVPSQSSPVPPQTPGVNQPSTPIQPGVPPALKPPVIPRRVPAPGEPPGFVAPQGEPQPGSQVRPAQPVAPQGVPTPQAVPSPAGPQRRFAPSPASSGGMVSLNFNRADLIEIIHIIAQQLRLTYTIDPDV
ncbi:MAG: hypothetical protein ACREP3_15235, partial [Candidatus Binatia bacterium]